jgi:hypothetical protein
VSSRWLVAEATVYGRVIAAWPSFALICAYELLMRQIRNSASGLQPPRGRPASAETLRIGLRVGAATARQLKNLIRASAAQSHPAHRVARAG